MKLTALAIILAAAPMVATAQNMQHTVVERRVSFPRGHTSTTVTGKANYAMSYVYRVGARADQSMSLKLSSKNELATFSVIAPDGVTMDKGFGVKTWTGRLPQTGDYLIVVVMNDEMSRAVSYTMEVAIK